MILPILLLAAAQPAVAPTEVSDADFRCMTLISAVMPNMPEAERPSAIASLMYYFGKIDARAPTFDYAASAKRADVRFKDQEFAKTELQRCGSTVQARSQFLEKLGQQLQPK